MQPHVLKLRRRDVNNSGKWTLRIITLVGIILIVLFARFGLPSHPVPSSTPVENVIVPDDGPPNDGGLITKEELKAAGDKLAADAQDFGKDCKATEAHNVKTGFGGCHLSARGAIGYIDCWHYSYPGTCDGNADGVMASAALTNGATGEGQQFWRHLALAGLIEGTYTGLNDSTTTGNSSTLGVNVPKSKLNNAGWAITNTAPVTTAAYDLSGAGGYGNYFIFGATLTGNLPATAVLKPEEAWNIDTKLDDGKPGTGKVVARYWNNLCATSTSNTDFAGNYKLSDSSAQCALYFPNAI
jgi:hypothetical protein